MNNSENKILQSLESFLIRCQSLGAERWLKARQEELGCVPDSDIRKRAFAEEFSRLTPALAAEVIEQLRLSMQRRKVEYESLYSTLLNPQLLSQAFPRSRLHKIIDTLRQRGYKISWWLLTSGPPKVALALERDQAPTLTLGERITLAKKPSPKQIEKLLYDRDESVIAALLNNPRLTEGEVLKIAASSRTGPAILQTISQNPRWMTNYQVKLALIQNVNTPLGVALGLLNFLLLKDLDEVRQSGHLAKELKETAETLLRERILSLSAEERSTLALGASPGLAVLLLEHPTPLVLLGLLQNPHLTAEEILLMAQDPRTPPEILERIGQNFRWIVEPSIAEALLKHSQSPASLRERLKRYLRPRTDN